MVMAFFEAVSKSLGKFSESNRKLILTVVVKITTIIIWTPTPSQLKLYILYIYIFCLQYFLIEMACRQVTSNIPIYYKELLHNNLVLLRIYGYYVLPDNSPFWPHFDPNLLQAKVSYIHKINILSLDWWSFFPHYYFLKVPKKDFLKVNVYKYIVLFRPNSPRKLTVYYWSILRHADMQLTHLKLCMAC
jgi:hypothetical protein